MVCAHELVLELPGCEHRIRAQRVLLGRPIHERVTDARLLELNRVLVVQLGEVIDAERQGAGFVVHREVAHRVRVVGPRVGCNDHSCVIFAAIARVHNLPDWHVGRRRTPLDRRRALLPEARLKLQGNFGRVVVCPRQSSHV